MSNCSNGRVSHASDEKQVIITVLSSKDVLQFTFLENDLELYCLKVAIAMNFVFENCLFDDLLCLADPRKSETLRQMWTIIIT